jgi:hypothetical protein
MSVRPPYRAHPYLFALTQGAAQGSNQPSFPPPSSLRQGYDRQAGTAQRLFQEPPAKSNFLAAPSRARPGKDIDETGLRAPVS